MFEYDVFTQEQGKEVQKSVTLLGLSTCGFCKRAVRWMKEQEMRFQWSYINEIDREIKDKIKTEVRDKFDIKLLYPILIVNDQEAVTGFTPEKYRRALKIDDETGTEKTG